MRKNHSLHTDLQRKLSELFTKRVFMTKPISSPFSPISMLPEVICKVVGTLNHRSERYGSMAIELFGFRCSRRPKAIMDSEEHLLILRAL